MGLAMVRLTSVEVIISRAMTRVQSFVNVMRLRAFSRQQATVVWLQWAVPLSCLGWHRDLRQLRQHSTTPLRNAIVY